MLIRKKEDIEDCTNCKAIILIFHASKVMLKILQQRLLSVEGGKWIQAQFRKRRDIRDHIANIHSLLEHTKEFQNKSKLCIINYSKANICYFLMDLLKIDDVIQCLIILMPNYPLDKRYYLNTIW